MENWYILLTRFIARQQEDIINHKMLPWTIKALLSGSVALTVNGLWRAIQKVMGELSFLLKWKTEISLHLPLHFSSAGDPHPEVEKVTDTWMTLRSCSGCNGHTYSVGINKEAQGWNWNIHGCFSIGVQRSLMIAGYAQYWVESSPTGWRVMMWCCWEPQNSVHLRSRKCCAGTEMHLPQKEST